jgi:hypothetical protein
VPPPEGDDPISRFLGFAIDAPDPGEGPTEAEKARATVAHVAEAKLYGELRAIMLDRGFAGAVAAAERAMQDLLREARGDGRSTGGYIG